MNLSPIPKKLLPHSAVLTVAYEADLWGNESSAAAAPMDNVRFEPVYKNSRTVTENGAVITAKLFFDCTNSSCALPISEVGETYEDKQIKSQTVTFAGHDYNVEEVRKFYEYNRLHHLEILLSG